MLPPKVFLFVFFQRKKNKEQLKKGSEKKKLEVRREGRKKEKSRRKGEELKEGRKEDREGRRILG